MKRSYFIRGAILVIIFAIILTGCSVKGENSTTSTIDVTTSEVDSEEYKKLRENFFYECQELNNERDICLSEFYSNPVITEELMEALHSNEEEYTKLLESAKNFSKEDYEEVCKMIESNQIHDGIEVIKYNETLENAYSFYEYGVYNFDTQDGIKILWTQNAEVVSESDSERVYKLVNSEEDAYFLYNGPTGFWMMHIVAIYKEGTYTREMYDEFYKKLEDEKAEILSSFARNPEITEEFLAEIYKNEQGYKNLTDSAKYLPEEDYKNVMLMVELGQIRDGIHTIPYNKNYFQKYYRYVDGEYIIDPDITVDVVWSQNFEDKGINDYYCQVFKVKNPKEDAYLLLLRSIGYQLVRITAIQEE